MVLGHTMALVLTALLQHNVINAQEASCGDGWYGHDDKCYKLVVNRGRFERALNKCRQMGSTLATVTSDDTAEFIRDLPALHNRMSSWIGGRLSEDLETLTWTESEYPGNDPIESDFRRWAVNMPQARGVGSCLISNVDGNWRNKLCDGRTAAFTCQKQLACSDPNCKGCIRDNYCAKCNDGYADVYNNGTCFPLSGTCEDGWSFHDTHGDGDWGPVYYCYKLCMPDADYNTSETQCEDADAELTPIEDQAANNFVKNVIAAGTTEDNAWIGERLYHGEEPTDYNNFSPIRPPHVNMDESNSCVAMQRNNGRWKVRNCGNDKPFVCRRPWNYGGLL